MSIVARCVVRSFRDIAAQQSLSIKGAQTTARVPHWTTEGTTRSVRGHAPEVVTSQELRELYELKAGVLGRRPELAGRAGQALVRMEDRLACRVEDEGRSLLVDLAAEDGGNGRGPDPDQLMRAGLGAGLAAGYRIWAARLEVAIAAVELTVTCDEDRRGALGMAGAAVGWRRLRVDVIIASDRPLAEVRRVVETANRHNPMLANLSRDIAQVHGLTVVPAERSVPWEVTPSSSRGRP
jgi:uncharacterized OsmC-like protein